MRSICADSLPDEVTAIVACSLAPTAEGAATATESKKATSNGLIRSKSRREPRRGNPRLTLAAQTADTEE